MLNRDSCLSTWPHYSGVHLRCSWAQCKRALTYARHKDKLRTGRRSNSPPSCRLRDIGWRNMGLPATAESGDSFGVQTHVFYWRFEPFGNGYIAYG
ncbi:hypothetical protein AVEN_255990-1 [Araneus ventricosus]|uniref:Uncharacterized protein n=1 Tax=Araneus ventricosus TaxID=182803 RepID=A0A4Y2U1C0_ARAVE|nr:hypothetical protein AVEN_255990-1 [Araneus ventricosus]